MNKYKKWIAVSVFVFLSLGAFLIGYVQRQQKKSTPLSLIYIPKAVDGTNDFWTSLIAGTRMAALEYGAELTVTGPDAEQDVEQQNQLLRRAIEKKPDAILISPSSFTASDQLLREAGEKNIPVTFIDSYTEEKLQSLTVSTDNLEVGRQLGEFAEGLVSDTGQIAIVSHVKGVSTAVEREEGFREGLGDKADNIVEVVYCNSLFDRAYALAEELMARYPDLEMIAGMNEYSSVGAALAVKDAGAQGRIKAVGVDSSQEAVTLMEQGVFQGLVVQKAFRMGYMGVKETIRMLKGEKVEEAQDSGCQLVTPENMYDREIEKLLFPFNTGKQK